MPTVPPMSKVALLNRLLRALALCSPEDLSALEYRLERERDSDEISPPVAAVYFRLVTLVAVEWQERAGEGLLGVEAHDLIMVDRDEAPDEARDDVE